ncbi:MAG: amidohydrolase, partial [Delftia acidovorans]
MPELTYALSPSKPALQLPAGACDTHVHVFGPGTQFPYAAGRSFTPADAGKHTLFALHRHLGVSRCVIVQSACHGLDNSAVQDAIAAGGGNYLGVALVAADVSDG